MYCQIYKLNSNCDKSLEYIPKICCLLNFDKFDGSYEVPGVYGKTICKKYVLNEKVKLIARSCSNNAFVGVISTCLVHLTYIR